MVKAHETYKYHLKQGNNVVYRGITYDLKRREAEHQKQFPGSHIVQVGRPATRDAALKWERETRKNVYK